MHFILPSALCKNVVSKDTLTVYFIGGAVMLIIVGVILLAILMFVLIKGKMSPITAFILLPVIAAFVVGYSPEEVGQFMSSGVQSMVSTASLFAFSITYFSVMSDAGLFDPLLNGLSRICKNNVYAILFCALAATFIAHLDGSGATTFLIVVPTFLPICKRAGIRPEALLCTMCGTYAVNNLLPWGGPTTRAASVLGMEPGQLYMYIVPSLGVILVLSLVLAFSVARIEIRNGAGSILAQNDEISASMNAGAYEKKAKGAKYWINMILTIGVLVILFKEVFSANICFMIGSALALLINFPHVKEQNKRIKSYAAQAMVMTMTLFAVGIFLGIMKDGGFIDAIANGIIAIVPASFLGHAHWFLALLSVPLIMMLSTDAFYYILLPIVIGVVTPYSIPATSVAATFLTTATFGTAISPGVAAVYVGLGLADVDLGTHIKYSFRLLWPLSIIGLILSTLIGVVHF
jgi:CitMHS family citrate-Mg2+:H+ or citrate-Ca2+:H+ symporter